MSTHHLAMDHLQVDIFHRAMAMDLPHHRRGHHLAMAFRLLLATEHRRHHRATGLRLLATEHHRHHRATGLHLLATEHRLLLAMELPRLLDMVLLHLQAMAIRLLAMLHLQDTVHRLLATDIRLLLAMDIRLLAMDIRLTLVMELLHHQDMVVDMAPFLLEVAVRREERAKEKEKGRRRQRPKRSQNLRRRKRLLLQ